MEDKVRVVSTKKLLPAQRQYLLNANFALIDADYIEVRSKAFTISAKTADYLIFSSQNAVESILANSELNALRTKKCFAVGQKTKTALETNGFEVIALADYAAELASIICNQYADKSYTFFCGNLRKEILPEALKLAGVNFQEVEVYETMLRPQRILSKPDVILFFSPSAVESYLQSNAITNETCFCIGKTTAELVEKVTSQLIVANQPSVENVIIQCIKHYS